MILIEKVSIVGLEPALRGMRNPMNSHDRSDSNYCMIMDDPESVEYMVGENDHELMSTLSKAGPVHAKFRRMIVVYLDIIAPLYWWKEFDTYKVGTVANSCSTMHKIHAKEFVREDFSVEHLTNYGAFTGEHGFLEDSASYAHAKIMGLVIDSLNGARNRYLDYKSRGKDWETRAKDAWWQMIQLLPSSYNQKRTLMLNYEVLSKIHRERKDHKLDEWVEFCKVIEELPNSDIITV